MKAPPASRAELDEVIVNIELTLASIVQGLALSFLAENAGAVLSKGPPTSWPYVGVALLIILLFWSRALIHTLTLIRWPLEFVHNFFYFVCGLVEVLAFKHLSDPFMWFVLNAVFAALVWALFVHDLRIIRARARDSIGVEQFPPLCDRGSGSMAEHSFYHALRLFLHPRLCLRHQSCSGILSRAQWSPAAHRLSGNRTFGVSFLCGSVVRSYYTIDFGYARGMAR